MLLKQSDLDFMLAQILFGSNPPAGTNPFSTQGIRNVNGFFNNLLHNPNFVDQYGNLVNTDTFGTPNVPFIYMAPKVFDNLASNGDNVDPATFIANNPALFSGVNAAMVAAFLPPATATVSTNIGNNYAQHLNVLDASPRTISNLVADMSLAPPSATGNPGNPALKITPFSSLFTTFGQFVDHGLDFIDKGGAGKVLIPVLPTDPLYVPGGVNLMPLTRASLDVNGLTNNSTAPLVDQQQTYGSEPSTRFFLMEYTANVVGGVALGIETGRLLSHAGGGMPTWADVKANALLRGITLTDADINNIPTIVIGTDLITGAITSYSRGAGTGQVFLADIAHTANPYSSAGTLLTPDADAIIGGTPLAGQYDNELLDAHYIAGDGRVNENVALTSIHQVFHDQHNILVAQVQEMIAQREQLQPGYAAQWTGEMIFEAAKLANEMQYQHIVFEFFARRMSPNITAFAQYQPEINPNITAEFSQAVFRLGHSMLTDTVDMTNAAGQVSSATLVNAFLNPVLFGQVGAGDIANGMSQQQGNQIDEFVVDAVRNFLVGLPLDLAALNIARGREVGLGSLNEVRASLFAQTGMDSLAAYTSWDDFGSHLLNPSSLVNFIAAYSRDAGITLARNAGNLSGIDGVGGPPNGILDASEIAASARGLAATAMQNAAFMAGGDLGFNDIDLWLGGLAEAKVTNGMLGSTFDFIFASQFLAIQNGDRFYYLNRLGGTNILENIEGQTFTDLVMQSTGAMHLNGDVFGTADQYIELSTLGVTNFIKSGVAAAVVLHEVVGGTNADNIMQGGAGNDTLWGDDGNDNLSGGDGNDFLHGGDGNDTLNGGNDNDFLLGEAGNDTMSGGAGLDQLFGGKGNDTMNGNDGDDVLMGGFGNDTLSGGNGADELVGGDGNDRLDGGNDADTLDGGLGNDVLIGGAGNDLLTGNEGDDLLLGGAGADGFDGGLGGYDIVSYETSAIGLVIDMAGGNPGSLGDARGDTFLNIEEVRGSNFNDQIIGNVFANILLGAGGDDIIDGGAGDDTLKGGAGNDTLMGGLGLDTAVFSGTRANYTIAAGIFGGFTVTDIRAGSPDGIDTVGADIEFLNFADRIVVVNGGATTPLISLTNTIDRVLGAAAPAGVEQGVLDGVVGTLSVLDGTLIPGTGIQLGVIGVSDPDGFISGVRTFALAGDDAAAFRIVIANGVSTLNFIGGNGLLPGIPGASHVNFEAKDVYHVTLSVNDGNGGSVLNYTLNITDVNDNRATITSGANLNVQEGTATNVVVYRVASSDLDTVGPAPTYSLVAGVGGEDNARFTMVNGEVHFNVAPVFGAPLDVGANNIYNILVGVNDGGGITTKAVTIHVTAAGANVAPTITTTPPNPILVAENTAAPTVLYDANGTDPNPADVLTFYLASGFVGGVPVNDNDLFNISTTGVLTFKASPNFENKLDLGANNDYNVVISLTDGTADVTQNVVVRVTNVFELGIDPVPALSLVGTAFTSISPFTTASVAENTAPSAIVLNADAIATAFSGPLVYSLSGSDALQFSIDAAGQVRFNASPNFEAPLDVATTNSYNFNINVNDGFAPTVTQAVLVDVTNVNEAPVFSTAASANVAENTLAATSVLTAVAVDPEGTAVTYLLVAGGDSALFSITPGGVLTFNASPNFEAPQDIGLNNIYDLTISATDATGLVTTQNVSITVTNVNELPVFSSTPGALSFVENTGTGVTLYTAAAADPDLTAVTYGIVAVLNGGAADAGAFTINAATGVLNFAASPNFEVPTDLAGGGSTPGNNIYDVTISATSGGQTVTQAVSVQVTNVNEAPVFTTSPAAPISYAENNTAVVYNAVASDPEGVTVIYSLTGTDSGRFNISATGQLSFTAAPDFETPLDIAGVGSIAGDNIYNVTISASDGTTPATTQNVSIQVTNVLGVTINDGNGGLVLIGTNEEDIINGNGGNDTLIGLLGNDTLNGGGGADIMNGGGGNDTMNGGNGNDTFIFAAGFGNDTINGFDANPAGGGQDLLNISAFGITAALFSSEVSIQVVGSSTLVTIDTNGFLTPGTDGTFTLVGVTGIAPNVITSADFILAA